MSSKTPETVKMWSHMHGIVDVTDMGIISDYPLFYYKEGVRHSLTLDGKLHENHTRPVLISMERAEKQGLVRKKSSKNAKSRIKYKMADENKICITSYDYETFEEMREIYNNDSNIRFICFVDNQLNECPPPKECAEWEEVPK